MQACRLPGRHTMIGTYDKMITNRMQFHIPSRSVDAPFSSLVESSTEYRPQVKTQESRDSRLLKIINQYHWWTDERVRFNGWREDGWKMKMTLTRLTWEPIKSSWVFNMSRMVYHIILAEQHRSFRRWRGWVLRLESLDVSSRLDSWILKSEPDQSKANTTGIGSGA